MSNLSDACQDLVKKGLAESISGEAVHFTGEFNTSKVTKVERSYAEAFHKRLAARNAKERRAAQKFHDFVITY